MGIYRATAVRQKMTRVVYTVTLLSYKQQNYKESNKLPKNELILELHNMNSAQDFITVNNFPTSGLNMNFRNNKHTL